MGKCIYETTSRCVWPAAGAMSGSNRVAHLAGVASLPTSPCFATGVLVRSSVHGAAAKASGLGSTCQAANYSCRSDARIPLHVHLRQHNTPHLMGSRMHRVART